MTQEDKELLLKDLCARLPYRVVINCTEEDDERTNFNCFLVSDIIRDIKSETAYWIIKPYLRPISSITEEEERELNGLLPEVYDFTFRMDELLELIQTQKEIPFHYIDWFNAHHFDYRGLIEMGLALKAPEDLYD